MAAQLSFYKRRARNADWRCEWREQMSSFPVPVFPLDGGRVESVGATCSTCSRNKFEGSAYLPMIPLETYARL